MDWLGLSGALGAKTPPPSNLQAPKKATKVEKPVEVVSLGPNAKEGELIFGVAHIFASFNDTFVVNWGGIANWAFGCTAAASRSERTSWAQCDGPNAPAGAVVGVFFVTGLVWIVDNDLLNCVAASLSLFFL